MNTKTLLSASLRLCMIFVLVNCSSSKKQFTQDFSSGYGIFKMGDSETIGRFGGGSWGRLNGADFDGDGDVDILANFGRGGDAVGTFAGLYIYENIGSATDGLLDDGTKLGNKEGHSFLGDSNGDGLTDVFCQGELWINKSTDSKIVFEGPVESDFPDWSAAGVCDWDNDGIQDEFIKSFWHLDMVNGKTGDTTRFQVGSKELMEDIFNRPFVVDWDGDNDLDLLIGQESGHITFVENKNGAFLGEKFIQQKNPNVKSGCASVPTLADWDGDGDTDIIVGTATGFLEYYECHNGGFKPVKRMHAGGKEIRFLAGELGSVQGPGEARWGYLCPNIVDWDMDGDLDIVSGCVTGENLYWENYGSKTSPKLSQVQKIKVQWGDVKPVYPDGMRYEPEPDVLVTQWRCKPVVMDWTGDGLLDYLTIDEKGVLACYPRFKQANGTLGLKPAIYPFVDENKIPLKFCANERAGRNGRIKFCFIDWDEDGDLDMIRNGGFKDGIKNLDNGCNFVYLECLKSENGKSVFKWQGELINSDKIRLQGHTDSPLVWDVDGNGRLDIVSGCEDGNVYWFLREWIDSL